MRFLVDAQLPPALARWLAQQGHTAEHVRDVGLESSSDSDLWLYADHHDAVIVSKDEDFVRLAGSREKGVRVLWLRIGNSTRRELLQWLQRAWPRISAALDADEQVIEVVSLEGVDPSPQ